MSILIEHLVLFMVANYFSVDSGYFPFLTKFVLQVFLQPEGNHYLNEKLSPTECWCRH